MAVPLRVIVQIQIYEVNGVEVPPTNEMFLTVRSHPRMNSDPDARVALLTGIGRTISVDVRELRDALERCVR